MSSRDQILFYTVFVLWCISMVLERLILTRNKDQHIKTREDRGTYFLLHVSVILSIIVSFSSFPSLSTLLPYPFFYIGIVFTLLGILLREISLLTLGKYFSLQIRIIENHELVKTGVYRYIRHPSYTGLLFAILGICISLRSLLAVIITSIICFTSFWLRIRFEEGVMDKEFGEAYVEYKGKTKKLIPFVF